MLKRQLKIKSWADAKCLLLQDTQKMKHSIHSTNLKAPEAPTQCYKTCHQLSSAMLNLASGRSSG